MSKTIDDFSYQWTTYTDNDGYYGSKELYANIFLPLLPPEEIKEKTVLEIGSGTGRIVNMMMHSEPNHIYAVEPSNAYEALMKNTASVRSSVTCIKASGEDIPGDLSVDIVVSIGVLHHIPDPKPVVLSAHRALKSGGKMFVWLYGKENNGFYIFITGLLRRMLRHMPKSITKLFSWTLTLLLQPYCLAVKCGLNLPLAKYLKAVFIPVGLKKQYLIVFDQLNPLWAKYYTKDEAEALLRDGGFSKVQVYHREGYSWSVLGVKE